MNKIEDFYNFEELERIIKKYIAENKDLYYKDNEYLRQANPPEITIEDILYDDIFAYACQYGFEATKKMLENAKGRIIRIVPKKGFEEVRDYPLDYFYD